MTTKKKAVGKEAAGTQAVNRGHSVSIIEVPDEEDDTAYQIWLAKEQTPAIAKKGDEPSSVPPTKTDSPHAFRLDASRLRGELAWEQLYELRELPRYLCRRQSNARDFTLDVQLNPCTGRQTIATKALVDSGCTSSAINKTFVQKHRLDTRKAAVPITVYNADVTDLGSKDLYLGHDWLKRHNPVINWETSTIIFGRCQCVKNPFPLPDADPDDRWDEELEDGNRILAVNMEEELVIHAVHHANDLAAAAHAEKPQKTFEEMVPPDYRSFRDLFSKENFDELPEHKPWDHAIELIPNAKSTLDCKVYPLNRDEQEQLNKFLDENLESGHITESKSPFASPFFFVKKKDSSLWPVQDYRKLNEMTIKNRYPLPLISELIDKLQGAKYFTKLDDLNEHRRIVRRVLQRLRENKLFLKAEKCEFEVLETEYLSIIISEGQVHMDPVKLASIAEWPTPTKKKELQSFLGFTNFYRKFIKNYSKVVRALTQLTGNAEWTWGAAQNQAFQQLKKQMAKDVILAIPN
ncbi:uncharacterized protein ARMOST_21529 [Armillaria ostoyae]|uniref:Reverse transcriptase domain-containing protein n=1 Tax=Armillaria ostoyae TaxID=47428 RepID=A0A284SAB5_ARMOS|nr:uncharacterized protein ARMOST_21529 [Armillaria ostoyae]